MQLKGNYYWMGHNLIIYEEVFEDNSILSPEGEGPNMEWDTSFDLDISKYETPDQQTSDFHFRQLDKTGVDQLSESIFDIVRDV